MPKFYLGTLEEPSVVKYYLMREFKNVPFPHEESVVDDRWFDLFYMAREKQEKIELAFKAFMSGYQRGCKGVFS